MLAILVLIASASFTVNLHVCGGQVQSVALFEKAAPCPMEVQTPPCHQSLAKSNCCADEQLAYDGQDFQVQESIQLHAIQATWIVELPLLYSLVSEQATAAQHDTEYKPPLLQHDIPVLIQSFFI